jgi:hypothetical protein
VLLPVLNSACGGKQVANDHGERVQPRKPLLIGDQMGESRAMI